MVGGFHISESCHKMRFPHIKDFQQKMFLHLRGVYNRMLSRPSGIHKRRFLTPQNCLG